MKTIEELNALDADGFVASLERLFEGAPRFVRRLADARPFESEDELIDAARATAREMPEEEQVELLNSHPRIGADPAALSDLSRREQGDRCAGGQGRRMGRRGAHGAERGLRVAVRLPLRRVRGRSPSRRHHPAPRAGSSTPTVTRSCVAASTTSSSSRPIGWTVCAVRGRCARSCARRSRSRSRAGWSARSTATGWFARRIGSSRRGSSPPLCSRSRLPNQDEGHRRWCRSWSG